MFEVDLEKYQNLFREYGELRVQRNKRAALNLMNGDVQANNSSSNAGISVRIGRGGVWGFSSSAESSDLSIRKCFQSAEERYRWLAGKQQRVLQPYSLESWEGEYLFKPKNPIMSSSTRIELLREMENYLVKKYPDISMRNLTIISTDIEKKYINSAGGCFHLNRPLYFMVVNLATSRGGEPVSLHNVFSGMGFPQDELGAVESYYPELDALYEHLRLKSEGVYAKPGIHDVVLDADLAGILSHEAIGHTCEADIVLRGSVAGDLMGEKVASELVTLVDIAHSYDGRLCKVPVFVDDEGVQAKDAVIIENGILKNFMHSRATAQELGMEPLGNARAHSYSDEPLVRMRNTMILPGKSKLADMIANVEDGYYLIKSSNGQADTTSEFMFGVILGYEIKNGKLGKAIKDMTISGVAYDVLKSITAVSDDYKFNLGTCGKKQQISVGMGGPAIRCRVNIGGQR
ncbi:MAG: TldD/PmbA family protein [Candidatus Cloacimonetes bacterium]|nr:TldD/PmbA family protein [Candidatus Cloacimonadota bacterium]